jgi:hypothetical protein
LTIKLIIVPFFLFVLSAFGQDSLKITSNKFSLVGHNDSLNIIVIRRTDNLYYYLLIKNNNKLDSILISKSQTLWTTDTCIIEKTPFNSKGQNEITLEQLQSGQLGAEGAGSFTTVQIWDIHMKTSLFYGATKWYSEIEVLSKEHLDNDYTPMMITCICEGSYKIDYAGNGDLVIKDLVERSVNTDYCHSDHEEGTYTILNGKYVLSQANKGK